jgi:hypothetical protein
MIVSIYAKVSGSLMVFGNLIDGVFWYLDDKVISKAMRGHNVEEFQE